MTCARRGHEVLKENAAAVILAQNHPSGHQGLGHTWDTAARVAPGEQGKAAGRGKGGTLSREANAALRSPPPAPEGTGLARRLASSARSSDGTASAFARSLVMHPGQPPSRPCPKRGQALCPSPDDLRLTEDMKALLAHLDVRVVDHLILGGNGTFSFAREGLLNG